jgi:hypothetical protein
MRLAVNYALLHITYRSRSSKFPITNYQLRLLYLCDIYLRNKSKKNSQFPNGQEDKRIQEPGMSFRRNLITQGTKILPE